MADPAGEPRVSARFPDLAGKAAVVTGTSRGIGRGIAEFLARQGMKLALAARSAEAGEAFAAALRAAGLDVLFVAADLATPDGARAVFDAAVGRFGRIDLLVNNAANLHSWNILDLDEERYRGSFEANVRMVYGLTRLVARHMADAGGGSIVNISSVGGLRPHRNLLGYDASKGASDAMTRGLAIDLARYGIRVNAVAPGLTPTHPIRPEWAEKFNEKLKGIPLGRAGTPEDIAAAVAFLASDAASYVTGQVLYVDGGLTTQLTPPGLFI
jgi:3-oxoacyl-[acyl-carrier protein] reductase